LLATGAVGLASASLSGCAPGTHSIREPVSLAAADSGPTTLVIEADWNDLASSLDMAVGRSEMAVVRKTTDTAREARWELITIRDEPSEFVARRFTDVSVLPGSPDQPPPEKLELTATVGRFRSPERERKLLEDVATRLKQLAGVDAAPKPKGW
jgi:hypothetical protein